MNDLIYITVRGSEYKEMARLLVRSLREIGQYDGDILVLTNSPHPALGDIVRLATVQHHVFTCHPMFDRVEALSLIDGAQCRSVTCLDADILCMKPTRELLDTQGDILYFEEPWQTIRQAHVGMYTGRMTDAERERWQDCKTINVGHFTVPGSTLERFTALYRHYCAAGPQIDGTDQAAFNTLIRSGMLPARPYRHYGIANCTQTDERRWCAFDLIHFAGYGGRIAKMREHYARLTAQRTAIL